MKEIKDFEKHLNRAFGFSPEKKALQRQYLNDWLSRNKNPKLLNGSSYVPCAHWLLKGRACSRCATYNNNIFDHYEFWVHGDKKPLALVGHLYNFDTGTAEELMQFCEPHKLVFSVLPSSWYNPGSTIAVAIWAPRS